MTYTLYRQTLTFDSGQSVSDVVALHKLVMSGYFHELNGGHDDARAQLNTLFLGQRPAPSRKTYPPLAGSPKKLLVQSSVVGDWSQTRPKLGVSASEPIAVDLSVEAGEQVEVQTLVNPVRSGPPQMREDGSLVRGKKKVLTQPNAVAAWFRDTVGARGLAVEPHTVSVGDVERLAGARVKNGTSSPIRVDVRLVRATGVVTDPDAFAQMLVSGIGRGRSYGAGLIRHRRVQ